MKWNSQTDEHNLQILEKSQWDYVNVILEEDKFKWELYYGVVDYEFEFNKQQYEEEIKK